MKTKLIIIVVLFSSLLLVISAVFKALEQATLKPPVTVVNKTDFSKTFPGKSTTADVIKINGEPSSREIKNGKTYFYYNTSSLDYKNTVVFEKDVELYALENIFNNGGAKLSDFLKSYGEYKTYYGQGPFLWFVFLERGVAIETDEKEVLGILYFVPQAENLFSSFFNKELGLSKEEPTPELLRP